MMETKRGDVVMGQKVLFAHAKKAGGLGMGEYPDSVYIVLQDGSVWWWTDPGWLKKGTPNPKRIYGPMRSTKIASDDTS